MNSNGPMSRTTSVDRMSDGRPRRGNNKGSSLYSADQLIRAQLQHSVCTARIG